MKNLLILLVVITVACNGTDKKPAVIEKVITEIVHDTLTVEKVIVQKESDQLQNEKIKTTFLNLIEAVNNSDSGNIEALFSFLDEDYVFKGKEKQANEEVLQKQIEKFQFQITDVEINDIKSSCDLAYLIVSFKKTLFGRDSGNAAVDLMDKVGLFVMRKNSSGEWKLLVQKTDSGFSHWFYMLEAK